MKLHPYKNTRKAFSLANPTGYPLCQGGPS